MNKSLPTGQKGDFGNKYRDKKIIQGDQNIKNKYAIYFISLLKIMTSDPNAHFSLHLDPVHFYLAGIPLNMEQSS